MQQLVRQYPCCVCTASAPRNTGSAWGGILKYKSKRAEQNDRTCLSGMTPIPGLFLGRRCSAITHSYHKEHKNAVFKPFLTASIGKSVWDNQRGHDTLIDSVRRSSPNELLEKTT